MRFNIVCCFYIAFGQYLAGFGEMAPETMLLLTVASLLVGAHSELEVDADRRAKVVVTLVERLSPFSELVGYRDELQRLLEEAKCQVWAPDSIDMVDEGGRTYGYLTSCYSHSMHRLFCSVMHLILRHSTYWVGILDLVIHLTIL